jgi:glycosyltransferase involved in cell wall biosynthesis
MSCGVPVLASRVGGLPELIDDGETSFLCPLGDVEAFAECGERLLTDEAFYHRMSTAARAAAVERFAIERILPSYVSLYERVLADL